MQECEVSHFWGEDTAIDLAVTPLYLHGSTRCHARAMLVIFHQRDGFMMHMAIDSFGVYHPYPLTCRNMV